MMKPNFSVAQAKSTNSRRSLGFASVIILLFVTLAGCHVLVRPEVPVEELNGLRATITTFSWFDEKSAIATYRLEWTQPDATWVLNFVESVRVTFRDSRGRQLEPKDKAVPFDLDPAFLKRATDVTEVQLFLDIPSDTKTLAIALGRSGLITYQTDVSSGRP